MEFKNLGRNVLDMLGDDWCRSESLGPFQIDNVYMVFSDIPEENVTAELMEMDKNGLIHLHGDGKNLSLTSKGVATIESMQSCLHKLFK
jgi:predicted transcriptional regulator